MGALLGIIVVIVVVACIAYGPLRVTFSRQYPRGQGQEQEQEQERPRDAD